MIWQMIVLIVGFLFLVKGADWFVEGASGIADKLGIPQLIIGLTIVAMGTSLPEAAVSITAALQQNAGIAVGNVVGSNILNILIILGITALLTNVAVQRSTLRYEIPFMIMVTIVLLIFGVTGFYRRSLFLGSFSDISRISFCHSEKREKSGRGGKEYSHLEMYSADIDWWNSGSEGQ